MPRDKPLSFTPREQARLASILARLASPHEGERAAAGLLASALVNKHNLSWADAAALLSPKPRATAALYGAPLWLDRRRAGGKPWRGYNRRRLILRGTAIDALS